ncbi:hypothetical protein CTAYLR_000353 [Chrysophaeum taylorii]|uniref:Uncharacterized protein n=1 Tax=Chrysophaeum taylorii TaxID=2483200 RepID=A0AAD7XJS5_9STRA|nr:hypothetical protein CTAYLR_000353 [Chrysophaeum taylorii]
MLETAHSCRLSAGAQLRSAGRLLEKCGEGLMQAETMEASVAARLEELGAKARALALETQEVLRRKRRGCGPLVVTPAVDPLGALGARAVLIDLDGTIYTPAGLVDGADDFYASLVRRQIPFCFVSNTGAKGALGVRAKLEGLGGFMFRHRPCPLSKIVTAAETQMDYMVRSLPARARVLVVAGGQDSWWMRGLRDRGAPSTWDIRTYLTEVESTTWAAAASASRKDSVFVALFSDGRINEHRDPSTGERCSSDWNFDVIKKASYVLAHGATLIVTAEDPFNPSRDDRFPGHVFPLPGPGMFSAMFRTLVYPRNNKIVVVGKGGASNLVMDEALKRLRDQGYDGDEAGVLMVGDRFDTDCKGAKLAGIRCCLVESGAHHRRLQRFYDRWQADAVCGSVADLVPKVARTKRRQEEPARPELGDRVASTPLLVRRDDEVCGVPHQISKLRAWTLHKGTTIGYDKTLEELAILLREFFDERKDDEGWLPRPALLQALEDLGISPDDDLMMPPGDAPVYCGGVSLAQFVGLVRRLLGDTRTFSSEYALFSKPMKNYGRSLDENDVRKLPFSPEAILRKQKSANAPALLRAAVSHVDLANALRDAADDDDY